MAHCELVDGSALVRVADDVDGADERSAAVASHGEQLLDHLNGHTQKRVGASLYAGINHDVPVLSHS